MIANRVKQLYSPLLGLTLVLIVVLSPFSTAAVAQTATATLFVTIYDEVHSVVPGVAIRLTNQATSTERIGIADEWGTQTFPVLTAGAYTLSASQPGFRTEVITDIEVQVGVKSALDVVLVPGSPANTIEVKADLTTLRPAAATFGEVLNNRTIMSMPLNGREFLELALLSPGGVPPAQGSELSTQSSGGVHIAGARESYNNFLLDGVDNNDLFINRFVINPSLDAIQEFTILTNNYDVEYGRSAGAQINVVTRSGGKELHGAIYEYFRHSSMDARNFFEDTTPFLRQNQFGGTLGGAIGESQNFFFGNLEVLRTKRAETRISNVPTLAEKSGNFSQSGRTILDPFTQKPFPDNLIPSGRIDPVGATLAGLYPNPNINLPGRNFRTSPIGSVGSTQFTLRTDHHLSDVTSLFFRYSFVNDSREFPFPVGGSNVPGFGESVLDRGQNFAFGATHILSFVTINEFRFGYNRLHREVLTENANLDAFSLLGMEGPALQSPDQGFPAFVVAGYQELGENVNLPTVRHTGTFHFSDVLSLQRGRHHFKIGGEVRNYRQDGFQHLFARGKVKFTGAFTGDALADLLLGFPTLSILGMNNNPQALRSWAYNFFLGDDWQVGSNLTLNVGIRYEVNSSPVDIHDRLTIFDPVGQALLPVGVNGVPRSGIQSDLNNWAPRLGLAWDPLGSGNLVVRAGYGIYYDSGTVVENSSLYFNPPNYRLNLFFTGQDPLLLSQPFPNIRAFEPSPSPFTLDPNFRTSYSQHWSLGLSGRVGRDVLMEARYVGSKGTKLVSKRNLNQPSPAPGPVDGRRPIPGFGDILFVESGGSSSYHALQLRAQKRFSQDLAFLGAYSYSKSMDNSSSFLETDGYNNTPQDSSNLAAEWGLSNFDLRHRLSSSLIYDLPQPMVSFLFQNWQLSSILVFQTGRPFTPRLEVDNSNTGNLGGVFGYDRPNLVGSPKLDNPDPDQFFDPDAFQIAENFSFGNAGRNILSGPGFSSLDVALSREFELTEDHTLQVRAEIFNALNRANFQLPDGFIGRPTFGRVLAAFPAREIQLALRLSF